MGTLLISKVRQVFHRFVRSLSLHPIFGLHFHVWVLELKWLEPKMHSSIKGFYMLRQRFGF